MSPDPLPLVGPCLSSTSIPNLAVSSPSSKSCMNHCMYMYNYTLYKHTYMYMYLQHVHACLCLRQSQILFQTSCPLKIVWSSKATQFTKKTSQSDEVCLSPLSSSASTDSTEYTLEDLDLLYQKRYKEGYDIYDKKYMSWLCANHPYAISQQLTSSVQKQQQQRPIQQS